MTSLPPKPDPTNPEQHAPGMSRTLEKNAEKTREDMRPDSDAAEKGKAMPEKPNKGGD